MAISFIEWLKARPYDPDVKDLLDFQRQLQNGSSVTRPTEFFAAITAAVPDNSDHLLDGLSRLEQRWIAEPGTGWFTTLMSRLTIGGIALTLFGAVTAVLLWNGVFTADFLVQLADPSKARGLITFLFSISTIAIFLMVAIAVFWVQDGGNRFTQAKDLLAILVGILGTILGFYFASPDASNASDLSVSALEFSKPVVATVATSSLKATLFGSKPAYAYIIRFTSVGSAIPQKKLNELERLGKNSGAISKAVKISEANDSAALAVIFAGQDAYGQQVRVVSSVPPGTVIGPGNTPAQ